MSTGGSECRLLPPGGRKNDLKKAYKGGKKEGWAGQQQGLPIQGPRTNPALKLPKKKEKEKKEGKEALTWQSRRTNYFHRRDERPPRGETKRGAPPTKKKDKWRTPIDKTNPTKRRLRRPWTLLCQTVTGAKSRETKKRKNS